MGNSDRYVPRENEAGQGLTLDRSKWLPTPEAMAKLVAEQGVRPQIERTQVLDS